MAVIEYDAYKQKLLALEPTLKELEQALNIESARKELSELQIETEQEGFWNDVERSDVGIRIPHMGVRREDSTDVPVAVPKIFALPYGGRLKF